MNRPRKKQSQSPMYAYMGIGFSLSTELLVAGGLGYWGGSWLDKRWGTDPWMMLLCLVLSLSLVFYHAYYLMTYLDKRYPDSGGEK